MERQPEINIDFEEYGHRIREARNEAGLNQQEFGKLLADVIKRPTPFSAGAISALERGNFIGNQIVTPKTLSIVTGKPEEYFSADLLDPIGLDQISAMEMLASNLSRFPGLSPVERLTVRRLEGFLYRIQDSNIKHGLINLINNQLDILEKQSLTGQLTDLGKLITGDWIETSRKISELQDNI